MPLREMRPVEHSRYINHTGFPVYSYTYIGGIIGYATKGIFLYPYMHNGGFISTYGSYYETTIAWSFSFYTFINQDNNVSFYTADSPEVNKKSLDMPPNIPGINENTIYHSCLSHEIFGYHADIPVAFIKTKKYAYVIDIDIFDNIYQNIVGYRKNGVYY